MNHMQHIYIMYTCHGVYTRIRIHLASYIVHICIFTRKFASLMSKLICVSFKICCSFCSFSVQSWFIADFHRCRLFFLSLSLVFYSVPFQSGAWYICDSIERRCVCYSATLKCMLPNGFRMFYRLSFLSFLLCHSIRTFWRSISRYYTHITTSLR